MAKDIVLLESVDHVEFAVRDLQQASKLYERAGFTCVGKRHEAGRHSKLYVQGEVKIILSSSDKPNDPVAQFVGTHGDGVINLGFCVANAQEAIDLACQKGAKKAFGLENVRGSKGNQLRAAISVFGSVCNVFVHYQDGAQLFDFFPEDVKPVDRKGKLVQIIDHITVNLEKGQLNQWADFYQDIFGFTQVRYFDIRTERTGLLSRAMRSPNKRVTMPFNEPTDVKSQIQEFIDTFHGPGVQHIAFHTSNIVAAVEEFSKQGYRFLTVPSTYYEEVPKRIPNVREDMKVLEKGGILVDGDEKGYLLQIFTEPVVGPFFYELIQRKGNDGFGEGNFRALFESIERDQMRRGVL